MWNKEHPIYKEMQNVLKELFDNDFTITVDGKRRYLWDSEKKEFIDLKEEREMASIDPDNCGCTGSYTLF